MTFGITLTYLGVALAIYVGIWFLMFLCAFFLSLIKNRDHIVTPASLSYVIPIILSTQLCFVLAEVFLKKRGLDLPWWFLLGFIIIHVIHGISPGANQASIGQAWGVIFGVLVFWFWRIFA